MSNKQDLRNEEDENHLDRGIRLAEHYIAIGNFRYYIEPQYAEPLYPYITKASLSGYNTGFKDDLSFSALHPCGLTFEWYIDIGRPQDKDYGKYRGIDERRFLAIMDKLPPKFRKQIMKELDAQIKDVTAELSQARHQVTQIEHDLSLVRTLKGKYVQPVRNRNRKHQEKVQDLQEDSHS